MSKATYFGMSHIQQTSHTPSLPCRLCYCRICMMTSFPHNHKPAYLPHVPQSYKLSPPRRCHQHCNICISIKSHSFSYSLHVAQSADPPKPRLHEHVVFTQPQACVFFACSAVLQAQPAMPPPPALQYLHKDDMPFSFIALLVAQSADPPKLSVMPLPLLRRSSRNARLHSARTHTHTYTHTHIHIHTCCAVSRPLPSPAPCRYRCYSARAGTHDCTVRAQTHTHTHTYTYTHAAQSADFSQA